MHVDGSLQTRHFCLHEDCSKTYADVLENYFGSGKGARDGIVEADKAGNCFLDLPSRAAGPMKPASSHVPLAEKYSEKTFKSTFKYFF